MAQTRQLTTEQQQELLLILKNRFEKHMHRHKNMDWNIVEKKLMAHPEKLWTLHNMETSGGEPDVVEFESASTDILFCDCSTESPKGRRSICYDAKALESRKQNKPQHSAMAMAAEMGIQMMSEELYRNLQRYGDFDTKTSSWVLTPVDIREKGGALFCDRRYGKVFTYHNGAESYYAARGFRGWIAI